MEDHKLDDTPTFAPCETQPERLVIMRCANGYAVEHWSGYAEDAPERVVFEETEGETYAGFADFKPIKTLDVAALYKLLWYIIERFDQTSRYSEERVRVIIEPGDKYESA